MHYSAPRTTLLYNNSNWAKSVGKVIDNNFILIIFLVLYILSNEESHVILNLKSMSCMQPACPRPSTHASIVPDVRTSFSLSLFGFWLRDTLVSRIERMYCSICTSYVFALFGLFIFNTLYLTELWVFGWTFINEDTLWCLSQGERISLVFNPGKSFWGIR